MSVSLEKLQRLRRQAGHGSGVSPSAPLPPAHDPLPALRRMLGIRERSQPSVPARACDRALPGDEIAPGLLRLEQVLAFDGVATQVDGTFARTGVLPTANMLFFDTETTGLSGGTGTRAFMVGASDFVPGGLRVRQLLITHLSAEPAMLREFSRWLAEDTRLVSYNGRCYDAPLLAARYRLARQGSPLAGIEHLTRQAGVVVGEHGGPPVLLVEQGMHLGQVRGPYLQEQFRAAAGGAAAGRAVGAGNRGQAVRLEQHLQLADLPERPAADQHERLVRADGLGSAGPLPVEPGAQRRTALQGHPAGGAGGDLGPVLVVAGRAVVALRIDIHGQKSWQKWASRGCSGSNPRSR